MTNNCLTQLKKVSKTRDDYLTDHIHFSFFKIDFAGEAFGKGESAFDVCCERNSSAKKNKIVPIWQIAKLEQDFKDVEARAAKARA